MQHRLTYRHIPTNFRKPQHRPLPPRHNKFRGCRCRHQQAFPQPISMITERSCIPCTHSHHFQGCPPMSLPEIPPARLPSYSPMSLTASPPAPTITHQLACRFVQTRMPLEVASHTTLQCCNTNQYNPLTQGPEHKWQQQQPELHPLL
jgi:hypothetical protein